MSDAYYKYHLFFCVNRRPQGEPCCAVQGAEAMYEYAKEKIKALDLAGRGKVRVNRAGCLDRCAEGPVLVVYPDGVWYRYAGEEDIDEIVREHVQHGRIVERLRI